MFIVLILIILYNLLKQNSYFRNNKFIFCLMSRVAIKNNGLIFCNKISSILFLLLKKMKIYIS